eukprot:711787-Rhodomonas_salina.4
MSSDASRGRRRDTDRVSLSISCPRAAFKYWAISDCCFASDINFSKLEQPPGTEQSLSPGSMSSTYSFSTSHVSFFFIATPSSSGESKSAGGYTIIVHAYSLSSPT